METERNFLSNNNESVEEVRDYELKEREIPKEFFKDPCNRFLYETALAELNSEDVKPEQKAYIDKFLDLLTNPPVEGKKEEYEKAPVDIEATGALKSRLDIILREQRELLEITPENENPFDIKVLKVSDVQDISNWKKLTGVSSLFIDRERSLDNRIEKAVIYLSDIDWGLMQKELENETGERLNCEKFLHEYRHTQRNFSFGNDHLFRFLDEIMTNVVGYESITSAFAVLCNCTKDVKLQEFRKAYESDDENIKLECLEKIKENFGTMSLFLIGGKQSSEHSGDHDGIKEQPLVKNFDNPNLGFMETLLTALDKKTNGEWIKYFIDNHKKFNLLTLEVLRYDPDLISGFCDGLEDADAPLTKKLFEALDNEIAERRKNNESSD